MSSETKFEFTRQNIDSFLKELAKEYRKQVGKAIPAELILIGGASVLVNYGFRDMTTDIDALILALCAEDEYTAVFKEASDNAADGDILGIPRNSRNKAAQASYHKFDLHACL